MNETLENIMIFINENTNILIGICLFLIFVLICYLIDNSIKSNKAKKELKKSQVNEETKVQNDVQSEIEKEENIVNIENKVNTNLFEEAVASPENNINLLNEDVEIITSIPTDTAFEDAITNDNEINFQIESENLNEVVNTIDSVNEANDAVVDVQELNEKSDVLYKNDKKLSEILFEDTKKEEQIKNSNFEEISNKEINNNIFDEAKVVNENMETKKVDSKVEIELNEDELENIMKKLKNISSIEEDDNYTNIF